VNEKTQGALQNSFIDPSAKSLNNSLITNSNPNEMPMPMSYENMMASMMRMFQSQMMGFSGMGGMPVNQMNPTPMQQNFFSGPQTFQRQQYPPMQAPMGYASRGFSGEGQEVEFKASSSQKKPNKREAPSKRNIFFWKF
jgi:hypothetical protein